MASILLSTPCVNKNWTTGSRKHIKCLLINDDRWRCCTLQFGEVLLSLEMDTETGVQILDATLCISLSANALEKSINQNILPSAEKNCWADLILSSWRGYYLPNPSARAGYDTRSIFKRSLTGLNSEFSFS